MSRILLDTSVAVPAVLVAHEAHGTVRKAVGQHAELPFHAALETYSVLTRLPGDSRLAPRDAARLLADRFGPPVEFPSGGAEAVVDRLAAVGVAGGAVYDALIGLTAAEVGALLLTRDRRAVATYRHLGVPHRVVG